MSAIEKHQDVVVHNDATSIMQVISRAASDPNTDVDKLERMMAMYERMEAKKAEAAFNTALSTLQSELPEITEGGQIVHSGRVISEYARWDEDIHPALRPLLQKHGFSLSFRTDTSNTVAVEAVLAHVGGHSERTSIHLPADTSGSKNAVQAVASSVAYGKRYTAGALLNFATGGQDDDAKTAAPPEPFDAKGIYARAKQHIDALRENWDSVAEIRKAIAENDLGYVAQLLDELDQDTQIALNLAPSKGGIFTTEERAVLKSDELGKIRREMKKEVANG